MTMKKTYDIRDKNGLPMTDSMSSLDEAIEEAKSIAADLEEKEFIYICENVAVIKVLGIQIQKLNKKK